jgi:hypothetical protein
VPKFTSKYRSLTLQGDGDAAPYAVFVDGEFETSDPAVIKRLRAISDGTVEEAAKESPTPHRGRKPAADAAGGGDGSSSDSQDSGSAAGSDAGTDEAGA